VRDNKSREGNKEGWEQGGEGRDKEGT